MLRDRIERPQKRLGWVLGRVFAHPQWQAQPGAAPVAHDPVRMKRQRGPGMPLALHLLLPADAFRPRHAESALPARVQALQRRYADLPSRAPPFLAVHPASHFDGLFPLSDLEKKWGGGIFVITLTQRFHRWCRNGFHGEWAGNPHLTAVFVRLII